MSKRQILRIEDVPDRPQGMLARAMTALRSYTLGPLTSSSPELAKYFGGRASSAGVSVDEVTALTYSAIWAALSLISDDISSLPLMLYKRLAGGGKDRFENHALYRLLHDSPNPEMSTMQWRRTMQGHASLWGTGYSEIERDGGNRPVAIWPITPDRVTPFRAASRSPLQFRVSNGGGKPAVIDAADMIVLPGMSFDGNIGYRVVEKMRESVGLALAAEQYGSTFFGNGTSFGGIISYKNNPNEETRKNNREALDRRHKGVENAHKFLALYGDATFQSNTTEPNKAQFQELRTFQIREVARWFKVPPHKLGDLADATFSNVEQQNLDYYTSCLRPWLVLWEQELSRKLIAPLERNQQFIEHVADGLLRADAAGRGELYSKQFAVGGITPNEIRNLENRDPIEGGDRSFVPLAMIPLDRVDEYIDSVIKGNEPPPPPAPMPEPAPEPAQNARVLELEQELALARRSCQQAEDSKDVALSALRTAEAQIAEARQAEAHRQGMDEALSARLAMVEGDYQRVCQEKTGLLASAATTEAVVVELREQIAAAQAEKAALTESALMARDAQARAEAAQEAADNLIAKMTVAGEAAAGALEQVNGRLAEARTATKSVLTNAVQFLIAKESDRARKAQGSPEKFERWLDAFYALHADYSRAAVRAAVKAWSAVEGRTEPLEAQIDALVSAYVEESAQQLRGVVHEATVETLPVALDRVLRRWEESRAETVVERFTREAA